MTLDRIVCLFNINASCCSVGIEHYAITLRPQGTHTGTYQNISICHMHKCYKMCISSYCCCQCPLSLCSSLWFIPDLFCFKSFLCDLWLSSEWHFSFPSASRATENPKEMFNDKPQCLMIKPPGRLLYACIFGGLFWVCFLQFMSCGVWLFHLSV